ncbi:MAG TPA: shikimate dehydrogenase [Firmicutes bacterium]|nr:shikimate dehydrogenase [Candidatus Fermentithermobacillaceae bacterium]
MGTFGFIIHPIDLSDVSRKFPVAKYVPAGILERILAVMPPIKTSHITGVESKYGKAEGWFVSCPLTPRLMLGLPEKKVLKKIIDAANMAKDLGAKVVGLGAFTSVVGDAGITIRKNVDIAVTTGNSYTVATAIEGTEKAAALMEVDMEKASVLVLGATGSIGRAVSIILADKGYSLTLAGRDMKKLERVSGLLRDETGVVPRITCDVKTALRSADVVICVSSSIDTLIEPWDLKPGAVVCDVSRPRNVSVEVQKYRDDVLVIEGGVVKVPGNVDFHFDFGFPPGHSYACMAETMILALEEKYEDWSLGREMPVQRIQGIAALAKKHGFELAGFRSFEKPVTLEQIERIKWNARKKKSAVKL